MRTMNPWRDADDHGVGLLVLGGLLQHLMVVLEHLAPFPLVSILAMAVLLQDGLQIDESAFYNQLLEDFSERYRNSPFLVIHCVSICSKVDNTAYTYMCR